MSTLNFQRGEIKYLLSETQYDMLWSELSAHLVPDEYHISQVCSVYYDSEDYELIRRSIERPVYKEKLRLRSYGVPNESSEVFVELKQKFKGRVYKRRVETREKQAQAWLSGQAPAPEDSQISREIDWFLAHNKLAPRIFIASNRSAYVVRELPELRVTFDRNIIWRDTQLSLSQGVFGTELLKEGQVLMEIKIPQAAPMWLSDMLSRLKIFPTSFSKYGRCYTGGILKNISWSDLFCLTV